MMMESTKISRPEIRTPIVLATDLVDLTLVSRMFLHCWCSWYSYQTRKPAMGKKTA